MAQDTIVILCKSINDALIASSQIERQHDLGRLFIFLGNPPTDKDLNWLKSTDMSLNLPKAFNLSDNPEMLGIRAGLMFANGWDLMYCWAHDCPTKTDIEWIKKQLKMDGIAKLNNIWGITRDHYILHGLGETAPTILETQKEVNTITSGLLIASALDGAEVDIDTAFLALKEISHLSPLGTHSSIHKLSDTTIIDKIIKESDFIDDDAPVSILVGEIDELTLSELKNKIANHGAIIQICQNVQFKPYRTIIVNNGQKIALHGK